MTTYRSERRGGGSRAASHFSPHYINGRQAAASICRSTGFYFALSTDSRINYGPGLENIVYSYARVQGCKVSVGRIGNLKCDFILGTPDMGYAYVQVATTIMVSRAPRTGSTARSGISGITTQSTPADPQRPHPAQGRYHPCEHPRVHAGGAAVLEVVRAALSKWLCFVRQLHEEHECTERIPPPSTSKQVR